MTPFEFGHIVGSLSEKEAHILSGPLSAVSKGIQNFGKGMISRGNTALVQSGAPWMLGRGALRQSGMGMAADALRNPLNMTRLTDVGKYYGNFSRQALGGNVQRNIGRAMTGFGMQLGKMV
jgi:hypothetical protein